jgi:cell division protein FtsL
VARRGESPITRTTELAELIASVVPRGDGKIHPATRSFQAIRIHVNRELADLEAGLEAAVRAPEARRPPGGDQLPLARDRIVKRFIANARSRRRATGACRWRRRPSFPRLPTSAARSAPTSPNWRATRVRAAPCCVSPSGSATKRGSAHEPRYFLIFLLTLGVLGSGIAVVYARQQHRQAYVELTRLQKQRDEINIEFSRLQLEQATWAETNRIEQVASERLGMSFPATAELLVATP